VSTEAEKIARGLSEAYAAVAEFVKPSVVQISVRHKVRPGSPDGLHQLDPKSLEDLLKKRFGPEFRLEPQQFGGNIAQGLGSGFVFDDRGHILTNNHVVDGGGKITVTFHDGVEMPATVVGTDQKSDVAVIHVDTTNYPALPLGQSSKLKVGELVMAVGSPFGLDHSVTSGIVSAIDRNSVGVNEFESFIQTDAAINPGNSGGPLVNMDGQVIGINAVIKTGGHGNDGVGLAIPVDMARTIADNLIKNGKVQRSRLGIKLDPLTPALARTLGLDAKVKGVVVGEIVKGSPADKAGLKSGDVITGFNGGPVTSVPTFRLAASVSTPGKELGLKFHRDGKEQTVNIVPAPYEAVSFGPEKTVENRKRSSEEKPKTVVSDFGLEVQELSPELAQQFEYDKDAKGLLISEVKAESPAEAAGLREGDLVLSVVKGGKIQPVKSVKEFEAMTGKTDEVALYVGSPGAPNRFVTLTKPSKE
jgi:serine protease Do